MTTTRASSRPLDGFEQALLSELRHHVAARSAAGRPVRTTRRRIAALVAVAAAACSVAVGGVVLRPDPAFAVEKEADGDVVVSIESLEDADGLEQALADQGVEADVSYDADSGVEIVPVPEGTDTGPSADPAPAPAAGGGGGGDLPCGAVEVEMKSKGVTFRLPAEAVDSDSVLQIRTGGDTDSWSSVAVRWSEPVC